MALASIFSRDVVPPTWVGFTNTIRSTSSLEKASMISARYGVTLLRNGPGMALVSGRTRHFSAHLETGRRSAGRRDRSARWIHDGTVYGFTLYGLMALPPPV